MSLCDFRRRDAIHIRPKPAYCISLFVLIGVLITSPPAAAESPILTDLRVEPSSTLALGSGEQRVTISVQVFDRDGDLKATSVKVSN